MKNRLMNMLEELSNYKADPSSLMQRYVAERLQKSFDVYEKEIQQSINFLTRKHEKSLIKRINKIDG